MATIFWAILVFVPAGALAYACYEAGFLWPGIAAGAAVGALTGHLIYAGLKALVRKPDPTGTDKTGLDWIETDDEK
jgi:hypothetical protein